MKVSRVRAADFSDFGTWIGRAGCSEGGRSPEIVSVPRAVAAVDWFAAVLGVQVPALLVASCAAECQPALGFGVGVVDPRAKRRFWD
jgi:hypothetical protein